MSYIQETNTREEYLNSKSAINTRKMAESSLTQFGRFTESEYHKTPEEIISDLKNDDKALEKIYTVLNKWITWLGQDHPEIITYLGRHKNIKKTFKAIHPNTQKQYLNHTKCFLEDVGGFDINSRRLRKRVRLPKAEEEEPEPLTKGELRILLDNCSNKKKTMLMVMKDSGMRIGEVLQLKKKDFDMTKTPAEIHIPAFATKTRKSRTTFVTRETRHILLRRLNEINQDELVFGTNDDVRTSVNTQISEFDYMRNKISGMCPRFLEKYDSNGRYKISLHSLRSFTATQCAEAVDESFAEEMQALIVYSLFDLDDNSNCMDIPAYYERRTTAKLVARDYDCKKEKKIIFNERFDEIVNRYWYDPDDIRIINLKSEFNSEMAEQSNLIDYTNEMLSPDRLAGYHCAGGFNLPCYSPEN